MIRIYAPQHPDVTFQQVQPLADKARAVLFGNGTFTDAERDKLLAVITIYVARQYRDK